MTLKNALVAEKICSVDRSDSLYIYNPYGTPPTTTIQALAGTYTVSAVTITVDTLTVQDEFIVAEHIYDFEQVLSNFDLFANRIDAMTYSVAAAIDKYVLNNLCEECTGTYDTPAGGFTTAANIPQIVSDLCAKVMGYSETYQGLYLVIENSDVTGFMLTQLTSGYSYADSALNNGFMAKYGGVDIYVVRDSTFVDDTFGASGALTNSGHRIFGVKGVSTYCQPRSVTYTEKDVTLTTGKEIEAHGYIGFKAWIPKRNLTIDITIK